MSRCKACDTPLQDKDTPVKNKLSKCEEDLCTVCQYASRRRDWPREYLFGLYPQEGLTESVGSGDNA
jgi:hypothetical protein